MDHRYDHVQRSSHLDDKNATKPHTESYVNRIFDIKHQGLCNYTKGSKKKICCIEGNINSYAKVSALKRVRLSYYIFQIICVMIAYRYRIYTSKK